MKLVWESQANALLCSLLPDRGTSDDQPPTLAGLGIISNDILLKLNCILN